MANQGSAETLEQHQHEVCNAFARAAAAMRDAAHSAESFSNWFSRVNNLQNIPVPPQFNGGGQFSFIPNFGGPQQQPSPELTGKKRKAAADPEGKKKRQLKEKKPKDVNAPKRPPSAYLLFQNEIRKEVQSKHPDMHYSQILGEISKLWHELSPEERAPYTDATAISKAAYEKAKATYEAESPTDKPAEAEKPTKSKTPAAPIADAAANKSITAGQPAASDSSDESSESSSSAEEDEEEEEEEPEPEPPRKKSKKEVVKLPTPPPAKVEKKKKEKSGEVKKRKKTE